MTRNILHSVILAVIVLLAGLSGCKPDKIKPKWNPEAAVPLVNSDLTIRDVLQTEDTTRHIREDSTHFLTLVYNSTVYSVPASELLTLSDQQLSDGFSLSEIDAKDFLIAGGISLGQIAQNLDDPEGQEIMDAHGTYSKFPSIPQQSVGVFPFEGSPDFASLTFSQGILKLTVTNNFPVDIENLEIKFQNQSTGNTFATFFFNVIPANSSKTDTSDLTGKTVKNQIGVNITSISSPGSSSPVYIDTTDELELTLEGDNLKASKGTAQIPFQWRDKYTHQFQVEKGNRLRTMIIKDGVLKYTKEYSTFDSDVKLAIQLPYAKDQNGKVFQKTVPINSENIQLDLSGYEIDFTKGGATYNALALRYGVTSEGETVTFSTGDSIQFQAKLKDLAFEYLDGYIGKYIYDIPEGEVSISLYNNWTKGHVYFEDPQIEFLVRNSYGLPIQADFKKLNAFSAETGGQKLAITGPLTDQPINFKYPNLSQVGETRKTFIRMDKSSSNLDEVIALPPVRVRYNLDVGTNPSADSSVTYFVEDESNFEVDVNVALPLHGWIDNLVLQDSFDFSIDTPEIERIDSVRFILSTKNTFPVRAGVQLYFVNDQYEVLDSLLKPYQHILPAAEINDKGEVISATEQRIDIPIDRERMQRVADATQILVKGMVQTAEGGNKPIKIYSDQGIAIKLGVISNVPVQ